MNHQYLFLLTITPVQSFIEQARKTHDLYAGSNILSELVKTAIETISEYRPKNMNNEWLIFPRYVLGKAQTVASLPNRILCIIETKDPKQVASQIEDSVHKSFKKISMNILKELALEQSQEFDQQISTFPKIFWLLLPYSDENYQNAYRKINSILGGIKALGPFMQLTEPPGRKCALCGKLNALFYKPKKINATRPRHVVKKAKEIEYESRLATGEALCSICLVKRFYQRNSVEFPSTSEIALMNLIYNLNQNEKGKKLLQDYQDIINEKCHLTYNKTTFGQKYYDPSLLYKENLTPHYFFNEGLTGAVESKNGQEYISKEVIRAHTNLIEFINNQKKNLAENHNLNKSCWNFTNYYAVILFDGDDMGEWLAGDKIKDGKLLEFHRQLSENLVNYASSIEQFVQDPNVSQYPPFHNTPKSGFGKIVYAGGEDFLGFVNLFHALPALQNMRENFSTEVNNGLENLLKPNEGPITFSAGVLFAHNKTPLSEVLKQVRNTEREAKKVKGKNAIAIAILKRSGELSKAVFKWHNNDSSTNQHWITQTLQLLIEKLALAQYSNTFIRNLQGEFSKLGNRVGDYKDLDPLVKAEIKRLVTRSCMIKHEPNNKRRVENITETINLVTTIWEKSKAADPGQEINNFLSALAIIEFISREMSVK